MNVHSTAFVEKMLVRVQNQSRGVPGAHLDHSSGPQVPKYRVEQDPVSVGIGHIVEPVAKAAESARQ